METCSTNGWIEDGNAGGHSGVRYYLCTHCDLGLQIILDAIKSKDTEYGEALDKHINRFKSIISAQNNLISYYEDETDRLNYEKDDIPSYLLELEKTVGRFE